ncbi:hypothetical protein [Burkholderia anthina]|uniref:hypothetical protein n=1 Tax=Burkholderia anthina TaxID=179879 RepID=UPI0037BEC98D
MTHTIVHQPLPIVELDDIPGPNPFLEPDPVTRETAVLRLNARCRAWGKTMTVTGATRRGRDVLQRTKRTRYIVLPHSPFSGPEGHLFLGLAEAIAVVGGQDRLISAVANGYIPIVVSAQADFAFRRADLRMLRNAFGAPVVAIQAPEEDPEPAQRRVA